MCVYLRSNKILDDHVIVACMRMGITFVIYITDNQNYSDNSG